MDFRLLGLLEVDDEHGPVRIVPGRESALLALLLLQTGEALPADRIVEELWGDAAPENAIKSVQVYVSRLRKTLGSDRIETTPAGYRITLEPDELDVHRFEAMLRSGRLDDALALWRGDALADFRYATFAQAEARRLEELRDGAVAELIDARLARGETPIAELDAVVARAPLWERPRGQLMRALYLAGRQADALELYRKTRDLLAEELGVDPGPELQRLERAILNHDPELGTPAPPPRAAPSENRRRLLLAVGGALVAAAAVAAAIVTATGGGSSLESVQPNSVAAIDARTGRIVAQIGVGDRPSRLAVAGGRLWALNAGDSTISEIDTTTDRTIARFGPSLVPTDIAATGNAVWVGSTTAGSGLGMNEVARFDAVRRAPLGRANLGTAVTAGGKSPENRQIVATRFGVWAIGASLEPVQLEARTGRILRVVRGVEATSLASGAGELWAASGFEVLGIDPRTARVETRIRVPSLFELGGIAVGAGSVWVSSPGEGVVWRIELGEHHRVTSIGLAYGASSIAFGGGDVWVVNRFAGTVDRIDPRATPPRVTRVATIPAPQDIASDGAHVFVASGAPATRSGALTIASCAPVDGSTDVVIASDLPLQGPSGRVGSAAVATIRAVLRSRGYRAGRYRVGYQSCDDATAAAGGFDDGQCTANATAYANDESVRGVIGTLNSECTLYELPILNRAIRGPLAMVSPFNTGPFITRRPPDDAVETYDQLYASGPHDFVRTIGADHILAAAAASFARKLDLRRVAVLYDHAGMLQEMQARWFEYAARRLGVDAVPVAVDPQRRTFAAALARTHADGAFLVSYVLGTSPRAGAPVIAALNRSFARKPVLVTDTFPWPAASHGSSVFYALNAGAAVPQVMSASDRALLAGLPRADRIPWVVAQTASAARALLDAVASSDGTRRSIVERLHATPGIDRWGDPITAPVTIRRVLAGASDTFPVVPRNVYVATLSPPAATVPPG